MKPLKLKIRLSELFVVFVILLLALTSTGCSQKQSGNILGAGATFPYPVYSEMFVVYEKETGIKVNYQSIGSGGGIKQIVERTVDFGATDAFIKDEQLNELKDEGKELLHIPMVLGAVVISYNLPGVNESLQFDGIQLSHIFSGKITRWNDPSIQASNPNIVLPDEGIIVVHRSDSSGTTAVLTEFLGLSDGSWIENFGVGKTVEWFLGSIGAKGNEGVSSSIKQTKYSLGYVNFNYAKTQNLSFAAVKNFSDNYISPSQKSIASSGIVEGADDTRVAISAVGAIGSAYPISSFTWVLVYADQRYDERKVEDAEKLRDLLTWMVTDGQQYAAPLFYSPLPSDMSKKALKIINTKIVYGGKDF